MKKEDQPNIIGSLLISTSFLFQDLTKDTVSPRYITFKGENL